jgi:hypothetical protein
VEVLRRVRDRPRRTRRTGRLRLGVGCGRGHVRSQSSAKAQYLRDGRIFPDSWERLN